MTAANFSVALGAVLKAEGGNVDDPDDHGGRTSRGITQREYTAWRKEHGFTNRDVWEASDNEVAEIYHSEYWNPYCDSLPTGVDYMYFNLSVVAGPYRAAVLLQRALGVNDDGRIGPITREAIKSAMPRNLIDRFTLKADAFYRSLHQPKYTRGWLNRNAAMRVTALNLLERNVA